MVRGMLRVPLAGPRYGLSWGCLGFQGQTGVLKPGRSIDGRCGGRREQVEMSGSTQRLWFEMPKMTVGLWGNLS